MRVNGLYGHVRSNDVRSVVLFAGFIAAFHILAALALLVPLAMLDPEHAPLYAWTGYLTRWVPILTGVGALLFAVQMVWHVRTVRTKTAFQFVDDQDEPRLCRIVEPLAITAGLPAPYVGVIDSQAMNAFACGIRKKDAVLVFTRGLIDGLDDDELAAVAAHEIMHVVNGDIRTIAATNVCLDTLKPFQQRRNPRQVNRIWEAMMLPVLALTMPLLVVLVLAVCFLRRLAVDGSHLARLLISSAREFIADAEAVRLTQNPAALVSALQRIEGKSTIPGLAPGQDAMMIDGAHEGAFATHPTITDRVAALVAVTGSIALFAAARRDTRPPELRSASGFGRRALALDGSFASASRRNTVGAAAAAGFNRLGLTREMTFGAVAALAFFVWAHSPDLGRPTALAQAFDPAPLQSLFGMAGKGIICQLQGFGWLAGIAERPTGCDEISMEDLFAVGRGENNLLGRFADQRASVPEGSKRGFSNGTFSSSDFSNQKNADVPSKRCFQTEGYSVGDRGLHAVTEQPTEHDTISLPRWLVHGDSIAREANNVPAAERDSALLKYFVLRKNHGQAIHRFFGEPGLAIANSRYSGPEHARVIAALRQRLKDPEFGSGLTSLERAELQLLAANPSDFVSCTARRGRT